MSIQCKPSKLWPAAGLPWLDLGLVQFLYCISPCLFSFTYYLPDKHIQSTSKLHSALVETNQLSCYMHDVQFQNQKIEMEQQSSTLVYHQPPSSSSSKRYTWVSNIRPVYRRKHVSYLCAPWVTLVACYLLQCPSIDFSCKTSDANRLQTKQIENLKTKQANKFVIDSTSPNTLRPLKN